MSDYGDADPEDAYDAGDTAGERLDVLSRVVEQLEDQLPGYEYRAFRITDALRMLDTIKRNRREVAELRDRLMALIP